MSAIYSDGNSIEPIVPQEPYTSTREYYEAHRLLIQALKKQGDDIDLGKKLYAIIYALKDPMLAIFEMQQLLLPLKEDLEDDRQQVLGHRMDMATALENLVDLAESKFNQGSHITQDQATELAFIMLFLIQLPFSSALDPQVAREVQFSMINLAVSVLGCQELAHPDLNVWSQTIFNNQIALFQCAEQHNKGYQTALQNIQNGFSDFDLSTQYLTGYSSQLQNMARTSATNEEAEMGGYQKMADMHIAFQKAANKLG